MPAYDIVCNQCGEEKAIFLRLRDFNNRPICCGEMMRVKLSPINVMQDIQPYKSMLTGQMITSRSEHKRHLKAHGCIEVGNEAMPQRKTGPTRQEKEALRREISQRLDTI